MSSISITIILLATLTACHLEIALGAPRKRVTTVHLVRDEPSTMCVPFQHPYCSTFGYNHTAFPNPRQGSLDKIKLTDGPTANYSTNAFKEFAEFAPLMDTGCSHKLGTLLCFFYFPLCNPPAQVEGTLLTIRPCRSLCEEVTRDCAEALRAALAAYGLEDHGWEELPHFKCSHYEFNGKNGAKGKKVFIEDADLCANGTQALWIPGVLGEDTNTMELCSPCTEAEYNQCPRSCDIIHSANTQSFVRNKFYNFALRVTLNSLTTFHCKWALNFTVCEQYDLKSEANCSTAPTLPVDSTSILGLGSNFKCNENCFENPELKLQEGNEYFVAGHVRRAEDDCGSIFWELSGTNSMIVEWDKEEFAHQTKKDKQIATFIANGNKARECS